MTRPLILVTGATGTVGTEMIRHLVKAGHRVRALVRDRAKATKLGPKVELVVGDLDDLASLKPAFASVDEAFVVVNGKDLNRLEANAFDAAKSAGVSHIVKLSGRGVDWPSMHDAVLVPWHGESERRLKALGPSWTIPRPGFFASKLRSTIGCAAPTCGECRRPNSGCRRIIFLKNSDGAQTRGSLQHGHDLGFKDVAQRVGPAPLAGRLPLRGHPNKRSDAN